MKGTGGPRFCRERDHLFNVTGITACAGRVRVAEDASFGGDGTDKDGACEESEALTGRQPPIPGTWCLEPVLFDVQIAGIDGSCL